MKQLIAYTQSSSARVDYIFSTLLSALGSGSLATSTDKEVFRKLEGPKINYSSERISAEEFWIKPAGLLFQKDIKEQQITCFNCNGSKAFFETPGADFPFDIFAASFYLISRYEEYLPHTKDKYGRYAHENSLAYKEGFLQFPLVNIWLEEFRKVLIEKFPSLSLHPTPFTFLPTYDIDIAYSYLHKGALRNFGGFIKAMWGSEWPLVAERMQVLFGRQPDPFDSYEWLNELHRSNRLNPLYFFLLAQKNEGYDKNILPQKQAMKKLVKQHSEQYDIGIHPSWKSGDEPALLKKEIKTLQEISNQPVYKSRQHYIRMTLPDTYTQLIDAGITQDYSMGYGSINGFRASYCLPYWWYDLQKEQLGNLTLYPFCYMDANSYYEQHCSCEEAMEEMKHYYNVTKKVNGLFITIWHNHFLGTEKMFRGWREVYRKFCQEL